VTDRLPVLWQYSFSNFNEKARWALDLKRVPHRRRSLLPGSPRALAFGARGGTLPVLDLEGKRISDSTRIIEALERRHPDPPLYPASPEERTRALELEDFFDERAGHEVREIGFWGARNNPEYLSAFVATGHGAVARTLQRAMFPLGWRYARRRYHWSEETVEQARKTVEAALDRIEAEVGAGGYLVGDGFTVADLTGAALLYPLAWPAELQYSFPDPPMPEFLDGLSEHPAVEWVSEMWRRHRGGSAEIS
jgi:glutathione S-transferase